MIREFEKYRFYHFKSFYLVWYVRQYNGISHPPEFAMNTGDGSGNFKISPKVFHELLAGKQPNVVRRDFERMDCTKQRGYSRHLEHTCECVHIHYHHK